MKFVQYQDCKSPHQLPLARELLHRLGADNFRYVYRDANQADRAQLGWNMGIADEPWQLHIGSHPDEAKEFIENADVLLTGMREIDLFERRCAKGLKTFYQTERWFKSISCGGILLPGWLRLLHPRYFCMAMRFKRLVKKFDVFHILPIGVHSLKDMKHLGVSDEKMTIWGYFVEPSIEPNRHKPFHKPLRILWAGRMLKLKRVDTIVTAIRKVVRQGVDVQLLLVGNGPDRGHLERLSRRLPVTFMDSVPIEKVRKLMRQNDVYIFSSDSHDGWGAVVSEALEEGMLVFGTSDTGASATILSLDRQFAAGDSTVLSNLIRKAVDGEFRPTGIREWSVSAGAMRLMEML